MPPALQYPSDINSETALALEKAQRIERAARVSRIDRLWAYYQGKHPDPAYVSREPIKTPVKINLVELLADKSVASMLGTDGDGVRFRVQESIAALELVRTLTGLTVSPPTQQQQAYLDEVWRVNKKHILLSKLFLQQALAGHVFVKILPDAPVPRFVALDPRLVTIFWAGDDRDRVLWYRTEYTVNEQHVREDVVRQPDGSWLIHNYSRPRTGSTWIPTASPAPWPYRLPPIVDWANIALPSPAPYYGKDDLGLLPDLNDALNISLSLQRRVIEAFSSPKYFGSGIEELQTEDGISDFWYTPNEQAKIQLLEMQSDLTAMSEFAQALRQLAFDQGRELDSGVVQDKLGQLTNFGLRVLSQDKLARVNAKWLTAEDGLTRLCQTALAMRGWQNAQIEVVRPDPLPLDTHQLAQEYNIHRQNGLSEATYLEQLGFDPNKEFSTQTSRKSPSSRQT